MKACLFSLVSLLSRHHAISCQVSLLLSRVKWYSSSNAKVVKESSDFSVLFVYEEPRTRQSGVQKNVFLNHMVCNVTGGERGMQGENEDRKLAKTNSLQPGCGRENRAKRDVRFCKNIHLSLTGGKRGMGEQQPPVQSGRPCDRKVAAKWPPPVQSGRPRGPCWQVC